MSTDRDISRDELVLVLAPTGRDMSLACDLLTERAGVNCCPCPDLPELCKQIPQGVGAVMIAEEALEPLAMNQLFECLGQQMPWSDLPLIIIINPVDVSRDQAALTGLRNRANVTLLERPLRIVTLVSAIQAALRARRRQYEVRDLLLATREAVRHRDEFLAMLGHELRNPLATISTAMSVLDASAPPSDQFEQEQREIILRQTNHLSRLVDDLLDVSRITSGKIILQLNPTDLREVTRRAVQSLEPLARAQRHQLGLSAPPQPVIVQGDAVRLEQVLNNLITNAIKYTPQGGEIAVTLKTVDGQAVLSVKDNGLGIPPDLLPKVFELFTQAERSLDRSQGGLGIGLTLVRQLVVMHGGTVSAQSDGIGRGSTFSISLPITTAAPVSQGRATPAKGTANGHARRILLIEDHADARRAMQRLLQLWGHSVEVAEDGPRGVALANTLRPQIALVDIGLPGLDGYAVARQIRSTLGESVRLIALTGYGQPEDQVKTRDAGFDLHLIKPVDMQQLAQTLLQD